MLAPVEFYDQALFQADKVDNVPAQWLLTAEFMTGKLP